MEFLLGGALAVLFVILIIPVITSVRLSDAHHEPKQEKTRDDGRWARHLAAMDQPQPKTWRGDDIDMETYRPPQ
jgi:hypothetical protein